MRELVLGDTAADGLQHRLLGRVGERGVVRARARLHHAARDQLAGARAADRAGRLQGHPEPLLEASEAALEIEGWIGKLGPARERDAMLYLFAAPAFRRLGKA